MGIRRMQGTSAHLEYIGPKDGKRKSDCLYYKKTICCCNKLQTYLNKCVGRVYCEHFKIKEESADIENNNIIIITFVKMKDSNGKLINLKFLGILRNKSVGDRIKFKKRKYVIIGLH